ncbi:unnamed protein product [Rotaria sp. Silwood1]|nr:unnamed protein product [Rotaria sp. Silwood1]
MQYDYVGDDTNSKKIDIFVGGCSITPNSKFVLLLFNHSHVDTFSVNDFKNGFTSAALAAKYGIPSSTVREHNSSPELRIGGEHPTLLSNEQEQYLVQLFKNLEFIGVRLTKKVVWDLASDYVGLVTGSISNKTPSNVCFFLALFIYRIGKAIEVGQKWLKKFLQLCQGELKMLKEDK